MKLISILYRWQIKPDKKQQFVDSWTQVTTHLLQQPGSLGSRLHCGDDGVYYGNALWTSLEKRAQAFQNSSEITDAMDRMRDAVEVRLPETVLEPIADFLTAKGLGAVN